MIKIFVDRVIEFESELYGKFACVDKGPLFDYERSEDRSLSHVTIMVGDDPVELKLTEDELLFIDEQLKIKEIECLLQLTIDKFLEEDNRFSPSSYKKIFRIKENELEITAHFFDYNLVGLTTPYFCSIEKEVKHISLNLKKKVETKLMTDLMRTERSPLSL